MKAIRIHSHGSLEQLNIDDIPFTTLNFSEKIDLKRIAICIACSGYERQWGSENYIKLIKFLASKGYEKFLIVSGKDHEKIENEKVENPEQSSETILMTFDESILR